jgi:hypothetical protein
MLPVFARPEACPSCCYVLVDVGGVVFFSMSVGVAGEDRPIVAINAASQESAKIIVRPKENIVRPRRVKRPTVKLKTAAGTAITKKRKKTWMMQLPHPVAHGL